MMKTGTWLTAAVLAIAVASAHAAGPAPARQIAITFDDLPKVTPPPARPQDTNQTYLTLARIISTLRAHHAPATGFVIGKNIDGPTREADRAMLRLWLKSGLMLGNHSYSHANLCESSGNSFTDDVIRGDQTLRAVMDGTPGPRYFRYPYLCTGRTRAEKEGFTRFLKTHGWVNAPPTIAPGDYWFNELYLSARVRHDTTLQQRVRDAYLDRLRALLDYTERLSLQLFHRQPAQVLLIHSNDLNTDCLDDLLRLLEQRGYGFVSLDQALADPAYATPDEYIGTLGITWLQRWKVALGVPLDRSAEPPIPFWVVSEVDKLHGAR